MPQTRTKYQEPNAKSQKYPLLSRIRLRCLGRAAVADAALDVGSLFVVVPGHNQQIGWSIAGAVETAEDVQGFFKSFPTAIGHVAVAAPRRAGIVESRPNCAYGNLIGMMVDHVLVEILQV